MDQPAQTATESLAEALAGLRAARAGAGWPQALLAFACDLASAQDGAAVGADGAMLAGWPHPSPGQQPLADAARALLAGERNVAHDGARTIFAVRVPFGAMAVAVPVASPLHAALTRERLALLAAHAAVIEDAARAALPALLHGALQAGFAAATRPEALHRAAAVMADSLRLRRVALGIVRRGRVVGIALSDQRDAAPASGPMRQVSAALEAALDGTAGPEVPAAVHAGLAVLLEGATGATLAEAVARGLAPLATHRAAARQGRRRAWRVPAAALALLAAAAVVPHDAIVSAPFVIEPEARHVVTAPLDGLIEESRLQPGDQVRAGETVMALLSTRELTLSLAATQARAANEQREADIARARGNPAGEELAGLAARRSEAEAALLRDRIELATIKAPSDGVVLAGDLRRSLGQPVTRGQTLFETADLADLRAEVLVLDEHAARIRPGQRVMLAAAAEPGRIVAATIARVQPAAEVVQGRNVVRAIAAAEAGGAGLDAALRPGMEGVARIVVGRTSMLLWATDDLVRLVRSRLWI